MCWRADGTSAADSRRCDAVARIIIDCCQSESTYEQHFHAIAPQVFIERNHCSATCVLDNMWARVEFTTCTRGNTLLILCYQLTN